MEVDMSSPNGSNPFNNAGAVWAGAKNSDVLYMDRWSTMSGTLVISNISATPYAVGTKFKLFKKQFDEFGTAFGNVPFSVEGQLPVMDPASPGLGLLWDLSQFRTNGTISITGTASTPTPLVATPVQGTNVTFSWPASYIGWELLSQTRQLTNGLSTVRSNWTLVAGSTATNSITITNWINTNSPAVFYRLAHPEFQ
jgi:hypothetical protein